MIGLGQHMYDKGVQFGSEETRIHDIKAIMASFGLSLEKAMDGLNIKKEERDFYRKALSEECPDLQ